MIGHKGPIAWFGRLIRLHHSVERVARDDGVVGLSEFAGRDREVFGNRIHQAAMPIMADSRGIKVITPVTHR
jgi:hypothetical protein